MIKLFRKTLVCAALLSLCFVVPVGAYSDTPPGEAPFVGSCYLTLDTGSLGVVDVYIPANYQRGYLGLAADGELFNISSSSISGVLYNSRGTEYQFRISSWSRAQYRENSGNIYTYVDLDVNDILASNVQIAEEFPPLVPVNDMFPYVYVLIGGVVVLCLFLKRF